MPLSRPVKRCAWVDLPGIDRQRRDFLVRCCQGVSFALLPRSLRNLVFSKTEGADLRPQPIDRSELHLHPHYRSQRPLDATLRKVQAGLDNFVTEKYAAQISTVLDEWGSRLRKSPPDVEAIGAFLLSGFSGNSLRPVASRVTRGGEALAVRRNEFGKGIVGREDFLRDLRFAVSGFSQILTAELQVTSIEADSASAPAVPARLRTRVRYELVGSGSGFHREQRVGEWELEWEASTSASGASEFRVGKWLALEETQSSSAHPVFADISAQAFGGCSSFAGQLRHGNDYWRTVLDGACGIDIYGHNGISAADIDGDGFDDLYICQPAGLPNRLYRNRGDGSFEDITEASGLGILDNTACALFADFDNDGRQDVIVVRSSGPLLFENDGDGRFRPRPDAFQFATPPQGTFTGAAVADYDRDGWLDIYFCLYIYYQGTNQYKYPSPYFDAENGPPNFMMRNNRDGTFRDVTAASGLDRNNTRYSFCCGWNDFNRDGWPDLYVVNDFGRKNLYRNNRNGTFTDVAADVGVEDVGAGMSVCWFDYDNDGAEDLYVADMWTSAGRRITTQEVFQKDASDKVRALYRKHAMGNSLFRNKGTGTFQDASASAGVEMGRWSWSSDAWDFDHDGFPDLYIVNGMVSGPASEGGTEDLNSFFWRQVVANSPSDARPSPDYEQGWNAVNELIRADSTWSGFERNVFYANNRDGTFSDVSGVVGMDFPEDGRAFVLADFDHDGRQEIFLKNRNGPQLRALKNVMEQLPPSIAFRLRGTKSNRDAIGAVVTVETDLGRQTRSLQAGSGFLSQHSKEVFFGLGDSKGMVRASIRWPSGLEQELRDLSPNHRVWVEEGSIAVRAEPFSKAKAGVAPTAGPNTEGREALPSVVETWLLAPVTAPDFTRPDLAGQLCTLAGLRGKPVLLNFWVTQSPICQNNLKVLDHLSNKWAGRGPHVITVNVDESNDRGALQGFTRERRLSLRILLGSEEVAAIYNVLYRYLFDRHRDLELPTTFLIDDKGAIVKVYQGAVSPEHIEHDVVEIPRTLSERIAKALPFPGITEVTEFQRNHLALGSVFFQRGYYDQAEAWFQQALRDDPSSAEALYGLGSVYFRQEKNAAARQSFERAVAMHASYPDTMPDAWNNLGVLATREGRVADSVQCFQAALRLNPNHSLALDNLGNAYRQQKRWSEARQVLEHALEVNPQDAEANYSLGMVFAQTDNTDRAYEYLQKALQARPVYPEALNNIGILYLVTQRRDDAVASFEQCIKVAPGFDQAYLNLARIYVQEGAPQKARTELLELLKQHPGHEQAQKMLQQLPQ